METLIPHRRRLLICLAAAATTPALAQIAPQQSPAPNVRLIQDLVLANRILADQGVIDAFGHVSARHDKNPSRFLLSRNLAPSQVTATDILEYDLDGAPIDAQGRSSYVERFIHAAIYRARPDVGAVVHSHSPAIIPFSVTKAPLRPVYHMAGFLAGGVPVFEIRDEFGPSTDMLIRDPKTGAALAKTLGQHTVALMRGHGSVAVGADVRLAVMRAIYTETDARLQAEALKLGEVTYLNDVEAAKVLANNDTQIDRAWGYWATKALAANPIK
jgi:HCOMODA/2-hydroxy-3-carboxy-muconic semialdehyde decarboxylase